MSSLFDELTADDMIVKGKSTNALTEKKRGTHWRPLAGRQHRFLRVKVLQVAEKSASSGVSTSFVTGIRMMLGAVT